MKVKCEMTDEERKAFLKKLHEDEIEATRRITEKSIPIEICDCKVIENADLLMDNSHSACYENFCCNHKCKEYPLGSVAYFVSDEKMNDIYVREKATVHFGVVREHFSDVTSLQLYSVKEIEKINGVPTSDMSFPTEWCRTPKDWEQRVSNGTLFELTREVDKRAKEIFINSPDSIINGIRNGVLIKRKDIYDFKYSTAYSNDPKFRNVIDVPKGCWRIEKIYRGNHQQSGTISLLFSRLFHTYDEAYKHAKEIRESKKRELERLSNLTDYEYVVEEIERVVNLYKGVYNKSEEEAQQYKDWLLSLKKLERVEVCLRDGEIQWRYSIPGGYKSVTRKPKKWNSINLGDTTFWDGKALERYLSNSH